MASADRRPSRTSDRSGRSARDTRSVRDASTRSAAPRRRTASAASGTPVFTRQNYVLLAACVGIIVVAYAMMRAENEVDGVISLFVSPILLLIGYLGVVPAILWRPRRTDAVVTAEPVVEAA